MVNTRAKGRRIENKAKKELEYYGWNVTQVKGSTKWNKDVDFFGLFDLIAIKNGYVIFIQVKCNRKPNFKPFESFYKKYCFYHKNGFYMPGIEALNLGVEVWVHKDREGFKRYNMSMIHNLD